MTLFGQLCKTLSSHKSEFLDGKIAAANQGMSVNVLVRNKRIYTVFCTSIQSRLCITYYKHQTQLIFYMNVMGLWNVTPCHL